MNYWASPPTQPGILQQCLRDGGRSENLGDSTKKIETSIYITYNHLFSWDPRQIHYVTIKIQKVSETLGLYFYKIRFSIIFEKKWGRGRERFVLSAKPRISDGPVPATKPRKIPLATTRRRLRWKKFQTRQSTSRQMGQYLCKMTSKPTRYAFLVRRKVLQFGGAIFKPTRYALWVRW